MAGYQAHYMQRFLNYLERSGEHKVIQKLIDTVLPPELTKETGVRVDIVEPSTDLTRNFKALVARTSSLRDVSFNWNVVSCAEYEKQVKAEEVVKGDLIHMIQWYYVDDPAATLKFFHSLLRENGKLLIIHEADEAHSGDTVLWKTFKKEPCTNTLSDYLSAGDIKVQLDALELRYEELVARNARDITECFTEGSRDGEMLLEFMTDRENFQVDGRVLFDCSLSALLIHA
uniref:Histamine N-methyltransferase n=1 Tax=Pygocentrus nattereri TaxID=42514 RepID=A0A3B4C4R0_PYGNA